MMLRDQIRSTRDAVAKGKKTTLTIMTEVPSEFSRLSCGIEDPD